MRCDRKKLSKVLGVSVDAIKGMEIRQTLEKRLNKIGYTLKCKTKFKNKYYYHIKKSKIDNTGSKESKKIIRRIYNTNNTDKFAEYFKERTKEQPTTVREIANKAGATEKTVTKWDNTLIDKGILIKDGFYYYRLNLQTGQTYRVSEEEYKAFWKNKAYLHAFMNLQDKYLNGKLTLTEFQLASGEAAVIFSIIDNKYYFKIKKYKVSKTPLYKDTKQLLKESK